MHVEKISYFPLSYEFSKILWTLYKNTVKTFSYKGNIKWNVGQGLT